MANPPPERAANPETLQELARQVPEVQGDQHEQYRCYLPLEVFKFVRLVYILARHAIPVMAMLTPFIGSQPAILTILGIIQFTTDEFLRERFFRRGEPFWRNTNEDPAIPEPDIEANLNGNRKSPDSARNVHQDGIKIQSNAIAGAENHTEINHPGDDSHTEQTQDILKHQYMDRVTTIPEDIEERDRYGPIGV